MNDGDNSVERNLDFDRSIKAGALTENFATHSKLKRPRRIRKKRILIYSEIMLLLVFIGIVASLPFIARMPANAGSNTVKIASSYTASWNQNRQTVFARGDTIDYHIGIDSTVSSKTAIDLQLAIGATKYNPRVKSLLYSYDSTVHISNLPVGISNLHTSVIIPEDAAPATYGIRATVTSSNHAFPTNTGESFFIIKPPSQLGPFKTGTFTRDGKSVQGWSQLTLFENGGYNFSGCFQSSSFFGVTDALVWGIASTSGIVYQFNHTASIAGTVQFLSSHKDCWGITGTSGAIAQDRIPLSAKSIVHWNANVNTNLGPIINGVMTFIVNIASTAWKLIPKIWKAIKVNFSKDAPVLEQDAGELGSDVGDAA